MGRLNLCRNCGNMPSMSHHMTRKFKQDVILRGAMTGNYMVYQVRCPYCGNSSNEFVDKYQAENDWNYFNRMPEEY